MLPTAADILTIQELQHYLKIPKPTLYVLAQNGRIPAAKVGRHWRFRRTEIDEWLEAQKWNRPLQRRKRNPKATHVSA